MKTVKFKTAQTLHLKTTEHIFRRVNLPNFYRRYQYLQYRGFGAFQVSEKCVFLRCNINLFSKMPLMWHEVSTGRVSAELPIETSVNRLLMNTPGCTDVERVVYMNVLNFHGFYFSDTVSVNNCFLQEYYQV